MDFSKMNLQEFQNSISSDSFAYDRVITTLTSITDRVIRQKFYQIDLPEYVDIEEGRASFMQEILHNAIVDTAGAFETGTINTGAEARMDTVGVAVGAKRFPILNWAKKSVYSIFDIQQAFRAGNFDLVEELARARRKNWDLGLQETIMTGSRVRPEVTGLVNNGEVTVNTTLLTGYISSLNESDFQNFVAKVLSAYQSQNDYTAMPNRFYIPAYDFTGLGSAASATYPMLTKLEYLQKVFGDIAKGFGVEDFKILPLAYLNISKMNSLCGINKNRYVLLNRDADTLYAPVPVGFTMTQFGTLDNFNFYNTAYGQYAGTVILRPKEVLYLDHAVAEA